MAKPVKVRTSSGEWVDLAVQVPSANDPTFTGTTSSSQFNSTQSSGDEGGEIKFAKAATNTTIDTGVTLDVYQNRVRLFETGGTNRGGYFDMTTLSAGVGTNLTPGLALITSTTASAAVTEVIFNNVFTSLYNAYLITFDNMLATSNTAALYMQLRYGTTNQAAGYDLANINTDISGSSVTATNNPNTAQWEIGRRLGENNGGYRQGAGQIFLYNVGSGSDYPSITGQYMAQEGTNRFFNNIGGDIRTAQAYDGFRIYGSAGNLTGTIKVYGIK